MPCPFYKMDMCGAVKDPRQARLFTSRQRCMYEYKTCSIYMANQDKVQQPEDKPKQDIQTYTVGDKPVSVAVDCEFYLEGECRVMHRKLLMFEINRCANYSNTCPLRERALRMRMGPG